MTKIIQKEADLDFGFVDEFESKKLTGTIKNVGTERVTLSNLVSSKPDQFIVNSFDSVIYPEFPANSTLYFGANGQVQDSNGAFFTTDQGYGVIGTVDANNKLTLNYSLPSISIDSPLTGEFKLATAYAVTWTASNVLLVDIIITGTSGGSKTYSGIDATLGTYNFTLSAADGFIINDTFQIEVKATTCAATDTITGLETIATITITAPTTGSDTVLDKNETASGTANCANVDLIGVSSVGDQTVLQSSVAVSGGNWSSLFNFPSSDFSDSESCKFRVRDSANTDNYVEINITTILATLTIDSIPASSVVDTNFTVSGDSTDIDEGETVTLYAKKSTAAWSAKVSIGTATVDAYGNWETTTAELPSGTFTAGETANIRAEYGTTLSSEESMTVSSSSINTDIEFSDLVLENMSNMVSITSNKAIISCTVSKDGTTPTIGGETVDFSTHTTEIIGVVFQYDFSTDSVDWLTEIYPDTSYDLLMTRDYMQAMVYDSGYIYIVVARQASSGQKSNPYAYKIDASDGSVSQSGILYTGNINSNRLTVTVMDGKLYCCYPIIYNIIRMAVAQISDLTVLHTSGNITKNDNFTLINDGSDSYLFHSDGSRDEIFLDKIESDYSLTNVYTIDDLTNTQRVKGVNYSSKFILAYYKNTATTNHLNDGTTETTVAIAGKVDIANSLVFMIEESGDNVARINPSTLALTWNVDYSTYFATISNVAYDGSKYIMAGQKLATEDIKIISFDESDGSV